METSRLKAILNDPARLKAALEHRFATLLFKAKSAARDFQGVRRLDYPKANLRIYVDTFREFQTRANSCKKEPGTIRWLEEFVKPGTVLYDVGANVGAYSLVAASLGAEVKAFEPAYQNYYQLNRNVSLNGLDKAISVFPIAFSTQTKVAHFQYIDPSTGSSKGFYNEKGHYHLSEKPILEKATLIYAMDDLVDSLKLPPPQMLKIDVDGGEADVIGGAQKTLRNPALRTIQIEMDRQLVDVNKLLGDIRAAGFEVKGEETHKNRWSDFVLVRH